MTPACPRRFALLALSATVLLAAPESQGQNLPPPVYQGAANLWVLPSGAPTASYLSSGAGVHYTDGSNPSGDSLLPTADAIGLSLGETSAAGAYLADAGSLSSSGLASTQALGPSAIAGHQASANVQSSFADDFIVKGSSVGATGNATLRFTLDVQGSLSATPPVQQTYPGSDQALVSANLSVINVQNLADVQCMPTCSASYDAAITADGLGGYVQTSSGSPLASFTVTVPIGSVLGLTGSLRIGDEVNTYPGITYTAQSDFGAMHSFVDVLTPGVQLAFASGHDYGTPASVPEPRGWLLMLAGLLGLLARTRSGGSRFRVS